MSNFITASAKSWLAALNFIAPSISNRPPAKELACVYIDTLAGELSGHDFKVRAVSELADWTSDGTPFLAPYRALVDAIKVTTRADLSVPVEVSAGVEGKRHFVTLKASGFTITLESGSVAEYPALDPAKTTHKFQVKGRDLKAAIQRVSVAASKDDTLPILAGISFVHAGGALTLLATDRYRLATDTVPTLERTKATIPFLLDARFVAEVARRTLVKGDVGMELLNGDRVSFRLPGGTIESMVIPGNFPDVSKLFDKPLDGSFVVDRAPLLAATKVAWSMSERNTPVRLLFKDGGLVLHFNEGLFGGSESPRIKAPQQGTKDEPFQTAFNPRYLMQALDALDSDQVAISYPDKPAGIQVHEHGPNQHHKHLLMPVRLPSRVQL